MLRHYGFQDPLPQCENAVTLGFAMVDVTQAKPDVFEQCMADSIFISFFFCLRSCDYTKTNSHCRTTQFKFQDMQFHDANGVIPTDAAAYFFRSDLVITLFLDT